MSDDYKGFRSTEVHAFLVIDNDEEGIPAVRGPGGTVLPLLGTDSIRAQGLRILAQKVARETGMRVEHVKFTTREHVEWIEP